MNNSICEVRSLYKIALDQLCISMDKDMLIHVLKSLQPSINLQIIWKILNVNNGSENFMYNHTHPNTNKLQELYSFDRGRELATITLMDSSFNYYYDLIKTKSEISKIHEDFAITQQTKFIDRFNFSDHFDLELLLKLVKVIDCRGQLFTIFQICVQIKGLQFPNELSEEWIKIKILDNDHTAIFYRIEEGLKLGIFFGDAGWLKECARVLSCTYRLITTKWVCHDQNLELLKIIQCLTKWLLVVSKLHNYNEAKIVLKHMLNTIDIIEKIEERTFSMAYAYVAVSQYFYVLLEFDKAWSWAVKAIHELEDKSSDFLRMMVVSHAIRACTALNKLHTGKRLINQLRTYTKEINLNIRVDMLLNEAFFSMKAELKGESFNSYLIAIDCSRNLFGYYNLHTAIALVDYAYARYVYYNTVTDYNEAMQSLQQGIFIIEALSFPIKAESFSCMLLVHVQQIKALILEKAVLIDESRDLSHHFNFISDDEYLSMKMSFDMRKKLFSQAENILKKALDSTLNTVGVQTLLSAKSFNHLGKIYLSQMKFKDTEKMYLKDIEIKKSILDVDHAEIAKSLQNLGRLYIKQKKLKEAKEVLLQSSNIFMTNNYGYQYGESLLNLRGLIMVSTVEGNANDFALYSSRLESSITSRKAWLLQVNSAIDENCTKDGLSLENFKIILNSNCDNQLY